MRARLLVFLPVLAALGAACQNDPLPSQSRRGVLRVRAIQIPVGDTLQLNAGFLYGDGTFTPFDQEGIAWEPHSLDTTRAKIDASSRILTARAAGTVPLRIQLQMSDIDTTIRIVAP